LAGRDAIHDFWRAALGWGKWNFELTTEDVRVSGPLAIERGSYKVAFVPGAGVPPGMPAFTDEGSYLVQWELDDGAWRIVNDIATSRLPPPGTQ
jgi:ketosteroid isomerase-like protein